MSAGTPSPAPPSERTPLPICDPHIAERPARVRSRHEGKVRLGVVLFCALLYLPHLGSFGLWDPWETHYGAVTTDMVETRDWVSPWWGYKEKIGDHRQQGKPFYSKPVFIFWTEGFFFSVMGRSDLSARLPMAILAILAVFLFYIMLSTLWSRRVGLVGALVLATSPQFFLLSRQAQTDMPFVGTMLPALCFLMLALFAPRVELSRRRFQAWIAGTAAFVLLNVVPQLAIIATDLNDKPNKALVGAAQLIWTLQRTGSIHALVYGVVLALVLLWFGLSLRRDLEREGLSDAVKDRWLRRMQLVLFYVLIAQATLAKGLLGFALPGAIIFVWLLVSGRWAVLPRVELPRGVLVCFVVGLPWYVAMFCRHGMDYYNRFIVHDHFNRLASGVHQIDSGTFEHFIKWLGYGMWPWSLFVPLAFVRMLRFARSGGEREGDSPAAQAEMMAGLWFGLAFTLFTVSSTKFHHYIFPALPALAVLVALFVDQLLDDRGWLPRLAVVLGAVLFTALAVDIQGDPQSLRNLMTYKYDRPYPAHLPIDPEGIVGKSTETTWKDSTFYRHTPPSLQAILQTELFRYETWIPLMAGLGLLGLALFFVARTRMAGLVGLGLMASLLCIWSLNYYLPALAPHWSQKYLFESYYEDCTPVRNPSIIDENFTPLLARIGLGGLVDWEPKRVCQEDVLSWRITWRGETYYSYNELQPIEEVDPQFGPYLEERNGGETFYVLMERKDPGSLRSKIQKWSDKLKRKKVAGWENIDRWEAEVLNHESRFFQMARFRPIEEAEDSEDQASATSATVK